MPELRDWGSVHGNIAYTGTANMEDTNNRIVIVGPGTKIITGVQCSWSPTTPNSDSTLLRQTRFIIFEGELAVPAAFIDPNINSADLKSVPGINRILMDKLINMQTYAQQDFISSPVVSQEDATVTCYQFSVYNSVNAHPALAKASLSVQGRTHFGKGASFGNYKLR